LEGWFLGLLGKQIGDFLLFLDIFLLFEVVLGGGVGGYVYWLRLRIA
jgi:hypothetical protein